VVLPVRESERGPTAHANIRIGPIRWLTSFISISQNLTRLDNIPLMSLQRSMKPWLGAGNESFLFVVDGISGLRKTGGAALQKQRPKFG
jgi:hypothetical protein